MPAVSALHRQAGSTIDGGPALTTGSAPPLPSSPPGADTQHAVGRDARAVRMFASAYECVVVEGTVERGAAGASPGSTLHPQGRPPCTLPSTPPSNLPHTHRHTHTQALACAPLCSPSQPQPTAENAALRQSTCVAPSRSRMYALCVSGLHGDGRAGVWVDNALYEGCGQGDAGRECLFTMAGWLLHRMCGGRVTVPCDVPP
jgi:hypothetical protein